METSFPFFGDYLISNSSSNVQTFLFFMLRFCFSFHELVKITFGDQIFYLLFQGFTFLSVVPMKTMKKIELIRVLCVRTTFQGRRVLHKLFSSNSNQYFSLCSGQRCCYKLGECQAITNMPLGTLYECFQGRLIALQKLFLLEIIVVLRSHIGFLYSNMILYYLLHFDKSSIMQKIYVPITRSGGLH